MFVGGVAGGPRGRERLTYSGTVVTSPVEFLQHPQQTKRKSTNCGLFTWRRRGAGLVERAGVLPDTASQGYWGE